MRLRNVWNAIREEFSDWLYEMHCNQIYSVGICMVIVMFGIIVFTVIADMLVHCLV